MKYVDQKYEAIVEFLNRQTFPGFKGIPIAVILKFVWKEILRDDIVVRSNAMAFSFFISIFPGLLVILSLLPYLPLEGAVATFRQNYINLLPQEMSSYLDDIIQEIMQKGRRGLLSLSLLLALLFATSGVNTMLKGFHKSFEVTYKKQNLFQRYWKALKITLLIGLLLLGSLSAIIVGKPVLINILNKLSIHPENIGWFNQLRWLAVFMMYYLVISIVYRFGPAFKNKMRLFTPGATLATILSVISSIAFASYVENLAHYNEVYGSIGAVILILLWLQINSFIILIGYELNASIAINRDLLANASEDE